MTRLDSSNAGTSPALAILVTSLALGAFNFGLALLIVAAMGVTVFAPLWLGGLGLAAGIALAALAVRLWRHHLRRAS